MRLPRRVLVGMTIACLVAASLTGCVTFAFGGTDCAPTAGSASASAPSTSMAKTELESYGACASTSPGTSKAGSFGLVDDYPFKLLDRNILNPLTGFYTWNCTDFAFWRVNRDMGVTASEAQAGDWVVTGSALTPNGGNGGNWGADGNMSGWTRVETASVGDIISVHEQGVLGSYTSNPGHVGYIGAVADDGSVITENYSSDVGYLQIATTEAQIKSWVEAGYVWVLHNPNSKASSSVIQSVDDAKTYAHGLVSDDTQFECLVKLWTRESGWQWDATNTSSGAYGIPQALPGSKMASSGSDWETNAATQIDWGLQYITDRYSTPCGAWAHETSDGWY